MAAAPGAPSDSHNNGAGLVWLLEDTEAFGLWQGTRERVVALEGREAVAADDMEEAFFQTLRAERAEARGGGDVGDAGSTGNESMGRSGREMAERGADRGRRLTMGGPFHSWQSRLLRVLQRQSIAGQPGLD